jgi:Asp/Glu/hydantoin racemase
MRLLFINPNTSAHLTDLGTRVARKVAHPETEIIPATGRFGARYIATRATAAIAGHAALDVFARQEKGADVVLLACFGALAGQLLAQAAPGLGVAPSAFALVAMAGALATGEYLAGAVVAVMLAACLAPALVAQAPTAAATRRLNIGGWEWR